MPVNCFAPSSLLVIGGARRQQSGNGLLFFGQSATPIARPLIRREGAYFRTPEPWGAPIGGRNEEAHDLRGPGIGVNYIQDQASGSRNVKLNCLCFRRYSRFNFLLSNKNLGAASGHFLAEL